MSRIKDVVENYAHMDTEQLIAECRDYFKDTFGFRPETYLSGSNFETRAYYITLIMACDEYNENDGNNLQSKQV
jgi:hypothetical protein